MKIFRSARLKLTFWYLIIIMAISLPFSFFVYRNVIGEVGRGFRIHSLRTSFITSQFLTEDQKLYNEVRRRIVVQLALVNAIVFVGSASAGYFLAGKTLQPIEEVMEDQKRFIGDASHELRTPLTSIRTEIEVGLRDKGLHLLEAKRLLESNLEEVNKMQTLSNYLLSLSRYEETNSKLVKELVYLNKVVDRVVEKFKSDILKKKISLKLGVPEIVFSANETSIEELFSILLDNAIKYSAENGRIVISAKETGKKVTIKMSDRGIGIKSSDLQYIFKRFYRADMSRVKTKIDGYGLGLSIAKQIVNLHNGEISVESEIGKGSAFIVTLPK